MDHLREPNTLSLDEIEEIEKQALRCLYHATVDFGFDAFEIFQQSPDDVKDVGEDITREMLDRLGGYQIAQRILGNVDYRKARYVILPHLSVRQALFVDSKAEKDRRTATMQMSQTSLEIRQRRAGEEVAVQGKLPTVSQYKGLSYLTTTMLLHYFYEEVDEKHKLTEATLAAVPNGLLQLRYNPSPGDSIWQAGRNAPSLGEDFRVRLSFDGLKAKAPWRVQRIAYDAHDHVLRCSWDD